MAVFVGLISVSIAAPIGRSKLRLNELNGGGVTQ